MSLNEIGVFDCKILSACCGVSEYDGGRIYDCVGVAVGGVGMLVVSVGIDRVSDIGYGVIGCSNGVQLSFGALGCCPLLVLIGCSCRW